MSTKKYRIRLTTDEQQVNALVSRGRAAAYKQTHPILLIESRSDGGIITSALGVGQSTGRISAVWRRGSSLRSQKATASAKRDWTAKVKHG